MCSWELPTFHMHLLPPSSGQKSNQIYGDGGSRFLQNTGNFLLDYMASYQVLYLSNMTQTAWSELMQTVLTQICMPPIIIQSPPTHKNWMTLSIVLVWVQLHSGISACCTGISTAYLHLYRMQSKSSLKQLQCCETDSDSPILSMCLQCPAQDNKNMYINDCIFTVHQV